MKVFAVALLLGLPSWAAIAIHDVTVIDVVGGTARLHQDVIIRGDRIVAIGGPVPAAARIVNGRGKFLIPGLWDMHVHLWYKQNQLPLFLAFGVTGVQDMGSDYQRVKTWRAAIEKGRAIGPRIVTAGPAVSGEPSSDPKLPVLVAATPRDARRAFDQLWDMDVDLIKVQSGLPRDSYFALAEQARHWHLPLEGRIPDSVTAWEAMEARQRSIERLSGVLKTVSTDAGATDFFEQCATRGVRITPVLVAWQRAANSPAPRLAGNSALRFVVPAILKSWPKPEGDPSAAGEIEKIYHLVGLAARTPIQVLAGSDTGDPWTIPGVTLHEELAQLVAAGLTPVQALRAATLAPAQFLDADKDLGSVEKGKLADLVLLDANPLVNIRNTRRIAAVICRGRYFSRRDLDTIIGSAPRK